MKDPMGTGLIEVKSIEIHGSMLRYEIANEGPVDRFSVRDSVYLKADPRPSRKQEKGARKELPSETLMEAPENGEGSGTKLFKWQDRSGARKAVVIGVRGGYCPSQN